MLSKHTPTIYPLCALLVWPLGGVAAGCIFLYSSNVDGALSIAYSRAFADFFASISSHIYTTMVWLEVQLKLWEEVYFSLKYLHLHIAQKKSYFFFLGVNLRWNSYIMPRGYIVHEPLKLTGTTGGGQQCRQCPP